MAQKPVQTEQRVVLSNINWQQYEQLLSELGQERKSRLTYWRGRLEMMTPTDAHERCNKLIESLILVLVDELSLQVTSLIPVILQRPEIGCATEADAGYFFRDEPAVKSKLQLDLTHAPIPDLIVEIGLTKSNIEKQVVYAALGIPEVWRYITTADDNVLKGRLLIYQLQEDRYVASSRSGIFAFLSADRILEFLEQSDTMSLATALRVLRSWIQEKL
jgi:Uma2 family endonuclease